MIPHNPTMESKTSELGMASFIRSKTSRSLQTAFHDVRFWLTSDMFSPPYRLCSGKALALSLPVLAPRPRIPHRFLNRTVSRISSGFYFCVELYAEWFSETSINQSTLRYGLVARICRSH